MNKKDYESKLAELRRYTKFIHGAEEGLRIGMRIIGGGIGTAVQQAKKFAGNLERELGITAEEPRGFVTREKIRQQRVFEMNLGRKLEENAARRERDKKEKELEAQPEFLWSAADILKDGVNYIKDMVGAGYRNLRKCVPVLASLAFALLIFYALKNNFSTVGYTVINSVTGNAHYYLIFVLVIIIIGFYKLNKE